MSNKKAYNLKKAFNQQVVIYDWGNGFKTPFGVNLEFGLTLLFVEAIFVFMYYFFLHGFVNSISGLPIVYFTWFPWLLSKKIVKLKQDGKPLWFFIYEYVKYVYNIQLKNMMYSYDEPVQYKNKVRLK
ncbi:TcpE family conjugal transfer membrane protein [Macrococcoides canis]|uniref:TcpE family conjugal transfer membrane protein n=1 Tax=Macrococcoides canis TaxID=1855823 RepID=UPI0022B87202|nr:TcpE family conjugal transfer membrane protein [Macrococcus canis]WBF53983.1 conjugal transfer protein [Macrococcus canis]